VGFRGWGLGIRVWGLGFGIQSLGRTNEAVDLRPSMDAKDTRLVVDLRLFLVRVRGIRVWGLEYGIECLGFSWGVGVRYWGLGISDKLQGLGIRE
jgi:hypothetical protein